MKSLNETQMTNFAIEQLENQFLEAASRRAISAKSEAQLRCINLGTSRAIIRKLLRQKKIQRSDRGRPGYWGGVEAEYRTA